MEINNETNKYKYTMNIEEIESIFLKSQKADIIKFIKKHLKKIYIILNLNVLLREMEEEVIIK